MNARTETNHYSAAGAQMPRNEAASTSNGVECVDAQPGSKRFAAADGRAAKPAAAQKDSVVHALSFVRTAITSMLELSKGRKDSAAAAASGAGRDADLCSAIQGRSGTGAPGVASQLTDPNNKEFLKLLVGKMGSYKRITQAFRTGVCLGQPIDSPRVVGFLPTLHDSSVVAREVVFPMFQAALLNAVYIANARVLHASAKALLAKHEFDDDEERAKNEDEVARGVDLMAHLARSICIKKLAARKCEPTQQQEQHAAHGDSASDAAMVDISHDLGRALLPQAAPSAAPAHHYAVEFSADAHQQKLMDGQLQRLAGCFRVVLDALHPIAQAGAAARILLHLVRAFAIPAEALHRKHEPTVELIADGWLAKFSASFRWVLATVQPAARIILAAYAAGRRGEVLKRDVAQEFERAAGTEAVDALLAARHSIAASCSGAAYPAQARQRLEPGNVIAQLVLATVTRADAVGSVALVRNGTAGPWLRGLAASIDAQEQRIFDVAKDAEAQRAHFRLAYTEQLMLHVLGVHATFFDAFRERMAVLHRQGLSNKMRYSTMAEVMQLADVYLVPPRPARPAPGA